jgi:hypothetical protein
VVDSSYKQSVAAIRASSSICAWSGVGGLESCIASGSIVGKYSTGCVRVGKLLNSKL